MALHLEEWMFLSSRKNLLAKAHVSSFIIPHKLNQSSLIKYFCWGRHEILIQYKHNQWQQACNATLEGGRESLRTPVCIYKHSFHSSSHEASWHKQTTNANDSLLFVPFIETILQQTNPVNPVLHTPTQGVCQQSKRKSHAQKPKPGCP